MLLNRDRINDCLHTAGYSRRPEREQEFPRLILDHRFGVHVLKYVNPVERQQDLVDFINARVLFERDHFKVRRVRAMSFRFCSSLTVLRKSSTLAAVGFVFISAI